MHKPPIPFNEASRVKGLIKLDILDTEPEERFDSITRVAKQLFNTPIALITLVDTKRQWFKSKQGLNLNETSRDISICGHAIARPVSHDKSLRIFEVPDAAQDERFFDNPLTTKEPNIRSYVGFILQTHDEFNIGTLCIIDTKPRKFSSSEKNLLCDLGIVTQNALQSLRHEDKDLDTGLYNRRGFLSITDHIVAVSKKHQLIISLYYFKITNFDHLVKNHGDLIDLEILGTFVHSLKTVFENSDVIARIGKDTFVVLSSHEKSFNMSEQLDIFHNYLIKKNKSLLKKLHIEYKSDLITSPPEFLDEPGKLLDLVDKRIYENQVSVVEKV